MSAIPPPCAGVLPPLGSLRFCLRVNGDLRQEGAARDMLHPPAALLGFLDRAFGLRPGDLVFTGTPDGVAALHPGDDVELELVGVPAAHSRWRVQRA